MDKVMGEFTLEKKHSFNQVIDNFKTIYSKALQSKLAKKFDENSSFINLSGINDKPIKIS